MNKDTSIPVGLQTLLTELDFISQIKRGNKPIMGEMVLVDNNEWVKRAQKWWAGETKDTIMSKIDHIISKTVDAIIAHKETPYIGLIVNKLSDAREGISSLEVTYENFPKIKAKVRVLLQNIDFQLESYRHLIKGYINISEKTGEINLIDDKREENDDKRQEINDVDFFEGSSEKRKMRKTRIKKSLEKQS